MQVFEFRDILGGVAIRDAFRVSEGGMAAPQLVAHDHQTRRFNIQARTSAAFANKNMRGEARNHSNLILMRLETR